MSVWLSAPRSTQAQEPPEVDVEEVIDRHSPRGALWRAAAIPGWGQLYNRQYVKMPFVYAGLGLLITSVIYNNDRYLLYRHAWLYATQPELYPQYEDEARPFSRLIEAGQSVLLRQQRDVFRRNRDLSYIGIGLFHGLTILDAYVSAHLRDFDIDEDLSVRVGPAFMQGPGVRAQLRWN